MSGNENIERCDLCDSAALDLVYEVPGTARGLKVYVCRDCGLSQSLPRIDHVPRRSAFPDSGAGFGNIRYGKGFRTQFALDTIAKHRPLGEDAKALRSSTNVSKRWSLKRAPMTLSTTAIRSSIRPVRSARCRHYARL
jgi:hypothetical protein